MIYLPQRLIEELLQLRQMLRHLPDRRRGRGRTSGIAAVAMRRADLVENPVKKHVDEEPGALVARFFLTPDHLGLLEARQLGHQRLRRKRKQLLDAQQIDVVNAALLALLVQIEIDLAGA